MSDSGVRILVSNDELDAAIAEAGLAGGMLEAEEQRLIAADVSVCVGAAVALADEVEFQESMQGMLPPSSQEGSNFGLAYLEHLLAELKKENFFPSMMMDEVAIRIDAIRHWLKGGITYIS